MIGQQVAAQFDSVAIGKTHVKHGDVGLQRRYPRHRFGHGARVADDFEVRVRCEEIGKAAPNDFMVIDQENLNHYESFLLTVRGKNHGTTDSISHISIIPDLTNVGD